MSHELSKVKAALGYLEACAGLHANASDDPIMRAQIHAQTDRVRGALAAAQAEVQLLQQECAKLASQRACEMIDKKKAQAEASYWKRQYTWAAGAIEKDAAELARVRELPAKWRSAPQNPDEPLLAMAADELDAALSQPAEQPAAQEALPLMARRDDLADADEIKWEANGMCLVKATHPDGESTGWYLHPARNGERTRGHYRIADTDEHGMPVVERESWMPELAKYRWRGHLKDAWVYEHKRDHSPAVEWQRIEDYRHGQEGRK